MNCIPSCALWTLWAPATLFPKQYMCTVYSRLILAGYYSESDNQWQPSTMSRWEGGGEAYWKFSGEKHTFLNTLYIVWYMCTKFVWMVQCKPVAAPPSTHSIHRKKLILFCHSVTAAGYCRVKITNSKPPTYNPNSRSLPPLPPSPLSFLPSLPTSLLRINLHNLLPNKTILPNYRVWNSRKMLPRFLCHIPHTINFFYH